MASNGDGNLNTPNDTPMAAPTEILKKKRGRPRKSDASTPRKSVRQAEKKQLKKECVGIKLKGVNGKLDSDEDWSFDEEDDEYLSKIFKKVNNSTPGPVEEEDDDDDEEEDEDEEDDDDEDDALFQEDNKDVYDFDQQSSVMSQQGPKATKRWLSQQNKRGNIRMEPREGSSWGSNIYSHIATLLNTREDLDIYSRFLKCLHINRSLDSLLADLCKPFRSSVNDGPSASLRSLVTSISDSSTVVNLVREVVSDRFENGAHRIMNFVVVVKQPICGLRFCTGSTDTLHFSDILHCIDPKIVGDAAFIVEVDKTDVKRTLADVDTLVVSDSFHATIIDKILSTNASNLQRVVIGIDENKSLFGIFLLDCWNRAGVPYNRPKKYAATATSVPVATCSSYTKLDTPNADSPIEYVDAFFVRMGGKKDILHLVAKLDSKFLVFNVVSEYNFAFKRHGLSPILPIVLEGMYSTFPEVLGEEKSVLVVPDQLYRSLAKTLAKEIQTQNCKFKKCVLLDKLTRLPLGLFFDSEVTMDLQVDPSKVSITGDASTLSILSQETMTTPMKATTQNVMLVSLNGILVGFEMAPGSKSVIKCYEMISDNSAIMRQRPDMDRRQSIQTTYLSVEGSSTIVQLSNPEIHENTFVAATLYDNVPYCKRQENIEQLLNDIADRLFDLPLQVSLMECLFRIYQRRMVVTNDDDQSGSGTGRCVFCAKEYRQTGLYDHEARHLSLVKFKCHKHQMVFSDVKAYKVHREEFVNCDSGDSDDEERDGEAQKLLNISSSTVTECVQCIKCYDYFPQMEMLSEHSGACDGVSFQARTPLDTGDSVVHGECLVCGVCGLNYPRLESLCAHMHNSHLSCNVCKTRLGSIDEVSGHIKDHMARKDLPVSGRGIRKVMECDVCGDFYGTKANYYYHQWTEHGVVHPPIKSEVLAAGTGADPATPRQQRRQKSDALSYVATGQKKFPCKFCSADVKVSGRTYVKHLDMKHGLTVEMDCVCRICADIFETAERLSDHLRACHLRSGQYVNAGVQSIFSCDKCSFFGHLSGVVTHSTMVHCDPSPCLYECPHCPERMIDRRLWRMHLERHEETRLFDCADCCLHFRSEPLLADHLQSCHGRTDLDGTVSGMATKTEVAQFELVTPQIGGANECDLCKKACKTAKALEVHRLKHFRTRIFQCTDCQATFRSKMAMRRHIRVEHLNLEPERYECQICGKIVTQISMHMLIHKNARYQCEFCDKRFTKSAYYNEHIRIHKGEKPYECHICQRKFNKKSNLNVHVSFHEKHRDDYGNYLEIKPRGRGHPDYDPEKTRARKTAMIKYDAECGPDQPGLCMHDDTGYKMMNVMTNSKICDTDDLHLYIKLLQSQQDEPDLKRRKCLP